MHYKKPNFTESQKSSNEQMKTQSNDDFFFDILVIVYLYWVPEDQTINQHCDFHVIAELRERKQCTSLFRIVC